jgi:hypothetical protein
VRHRQIPRAPNDNIAAKKRKFASEWRRTAQAARPEPSEGPWKGASTQIALCCLGMALLQHFCFRRDLPGRRRFKVE